MVLGASDREETWEGFWGAEKVLFLDLCAAHMDVFTWWELIELYT